jgi:NAD(P)-dependent dehydrogenase (short-subunit alcohol dehydrogenase family)
MAGQVAGKVALVTGGASGIGEAVSELLAREGASVAMTDIDELRGPLLVSRIRKAGGEATFWHQDVTSEERWIEVVTEVVARYHRLDILVSNAGIGIGAPSIVDMTLEDWRRQTAINLDGVFLSVKHCLPAMRKGGGGSIIMMSSLAGLRGGQTLAGHAMEIAQGVLYLASDASSYVTGTELVIDGGMNAGGVLRVPGAPAHPAPRLPS